MGMISEMIGYFNETLQSANLEKENKYTFIELHNAARYQSGNDPQSVTIVDGGLLTEIEFV